MPVGVVCQRVDTVPNGVDRDHEGYRDHRKPRHMTTEPAQGLRKVFVPARGDAALQKEPDGRDQAGTAFPEIGLPPLDVPSVPMVLDRDHNHEQPEERPERE